MTSWWNDYVAKWQVDEIANKQNDILMKWLSNKFTNWQVDEMIK